MQRTHSVEDPNAQPSMRAPVLMPTALDMPFDYLVPVGTPTGALVEATLANRTLVGVVWGEGDSWQSPVARGGSGLRSVSEPLAAGASGVSCEGGVSPPSKKFKLKPVSRVIENLPPLKPSFMRWLEWVADYSLAPKGAVLSLCGLAHAARATKKPYAQPPLTPTLPTLTEPQQHAAVEIESSLANRCEIGTSASADPSKMKPMVLDGVTGSGKTEVYFHAIATTLGCGSGARSSKSEPRAAGVAGGASPPEQNPQVLVLVPEITLTHQWLERFEKAFGAPPAIWHSRMTPVAKARVWQAVARGEVPVVVGARSALFLPFKNLSLIVVDEEHDPSYKQEDGVLYHARDMAVARARFESVPILLVSATPSLETMENVREGKYRALHLASRYGTAGLPSVQLVDLRLEPPERGDFLSPTVKKEALATWARGEQVLFFLNRRGYAPLLLCRACGHRFQCADCSAWLVVHSKKVAGDRWPVTGGSLHCHHCGHKEKLPNHCPACNAEAEKLAACGPGVERIAEEVRGMVAGDRWQVTGEATGTPVTGHTSLVTLSSDESITAETWAAIEKGEVDMLVGTQMVAKGHHFPRLTLVVVVDADVGLDGADLRAGERSYQMLHQLGGRAGRAELAGQVLVQTYNPDHPVMKALVAHDRDRLMALEARERKAGGWPPFGGLAAILLDGKEEAVVRAAGQALARSAPHDSRIRVLGPAPAPLSKLRGQYRYRLLVKTQGGIHLQRTLRAWLAGAQFKGVRVKVDVNPYYFM